VAAGGHGDGSHGHRPAARCTRAVPSDPGGLWWLTHRESAVLALVARGLSNADFAAGLPGCRLRYPRRWPPCGGTGFRPRRRQEHRVMIGFLVAGLVIGALARLIKPGKQNLSILATLLLGLVGSVIGGTIANLLGTGDVMELNVLGFVVAVAASVALLAVAERAGIGAGSERRRLNPR